MPLVAVLGAGGPSGLECVKALVAAGKNVRCVVRSPEKYDGKFPNSSLVEVVKGDVTNPASLEAALQGADGAIFAASAAAYRDPPLVDFQGVVNTAEAAKKVGLKRVVLISSCLVTPGKHGWHPIRMMLNNFKQKLMDNKFKGEEALRTSGMEYTIVRPGQLVDEAGGLAALAVDQGDNISGRVSRADVGSVCVAALDSPLTKNVTLELLAKKPPAPAPAAGQLAGLFDALKPDKELAAAAAGTS